MQKCLIQLLIYKYILQEKMKERVCLIFKSFIYAEHNEEKPIS